MLVVSVNAEEMSCQLVAGEEGGLRSPSCWTTLGGDIGLVANASTRSETEGPAPATIESIDWKTRSLNCGRQACQTVSEPLFNVNHSRTYVASLCIALGADRGRMVGSRLHGLLEAVEELAIIMISHSLTVELATNLR